MTDASVDLSPSAKSLQRLDKKICFSGETFNLTLVTSSKDPEPQKLYPFR